MDEKRASFTATLMAYYRAYHVMHETPKIFDDFLAHRLVTEEERASIEYQIAESLKLFDPACAASCPDRATALRWMMRVALAVNQGSFCQRFKLEFGPDWQVEFAK